MLCIDRQEYDPRWDEFVLSQPEGTFFHLWRWREILQRSFGYKPFYLSAEEEGQIHGVLPLFLVNSLIFGRSIVAVPLGVYGGVVARSEQAVAILLHQAMEMARRGKARYLEFRGNPYSEMPLGNSMIGESLSFKQKNLYVTFIGAIDPEEETNLSRIPRKQRRMIRQGQKHGLNSVIDNRRLREFYEVYAASVRNLGTPVYSFQYFENLVQGFGNQCKILLVEHQGRVVAGVMVFFYKDQVIPYYGGALKEYLHLAPSDFMYWELMRYGGANGYKIFDFGRSKIGSGSFNFKRHWGFEPRPLPYWYHSINGHNIPDTSPLNPKLQWAIRLWRGLPLQLTMVLGPRIVKHIP